MNIDMSALAPSQVYHLLTQTIVPRPIAWVLTESGQDNFNLAPFSYFTAISSEPPLLMFSVGKKPSGEIKDTVRNVTETGKMVIHIANADLAQPVTESAATLEHGRSEVVESDLTLASFEGFELPRVADCSVAFGCTLYQMQEIGKTPQTLVFAEVEAVYIDPDVIKQDEQKLIIDAMKLNPLCRLGGGEYAVLQQTFTIARPQ
ncbi:flavin reductase family protein [Vibrio intestinalis]|uniref:flavin reductase family protein n=1 Tax=Vibrio intestinalis TaxID=2933291 RepID=UPI0021A546E1|nr:flavin reductase family protein [Vibrio intestinalis]